MSLRLKVSVACLFAAGACFGATQTWYDAGSGVWSLADLNWDAGTAAWVNGNSALFQGAGGTVTVSGTNTIGALSVDTDGYVLAEGTDGSLVFALNEAPINVASGKTVTVSARLTGSCTFMKTGLGTLRLAGTNDLPGGCTVSAGTLQLSPNNSYALQRDFNIYDGGTLDLNGCYAATPDATLWGHLNGTGWDGSGCLVNTGAGHINHNFGCTVEGNATIGGPNRIDLGEVYLQNNTLTKTGACQLCVRTIKTGGNIVINQGMYTLLGGPDGLGGTTPGDTVVNGGTLDMWGEGEIPERITFNGGNISQGWGFGIYTGHITFNAAASFYNSGNSEIRLQGLLDGPGPLIIVGNHITLSSYQNHLAGPISIYQNGQLNIGTPGGTSGTFGSCTAVTNVGALCYDRADSLTATNGFSGGMTSVRYGGELVFDGGCYITNMWIQIPNGSVTFKDAKMAAPFACIFVGTRNGYSFSPTNSAGTLNIGDGADIALWALEGGDGEKMSYVNANGETVFNSLTGIVNQTGGTLHTFGHNGGNFPGETDGIHFGHWPTARTQYNLSGGKIIVDNGYRFAIAIDGYGWLNQSGGEVWAETLTLNGRDGNNGYGEYNLSGGVMNVGTNGINAGADAQYLISLGGGTGGVIRAKSDFSSSLAMHLKGTNAAEAVTFEAPKGGSITLSGTLSDIGGFNKAGDGLLTLSGATETYEGPTTVKAGKLQLSLQNQIAASTNVTVAAGATLDFGATGQTLKCLSGCGTVQNGWTGQDSVVNAGIGGEGTLTFASTASIGALGTTLAVTVADGGKCGVLALDGNFSLDGQTVTVTNPDALDKTKIYTFATTTGTFSGKPTVNVPSPWFVIRGSDTIKLSAFSGTMIRFD